MNRRCTRAFQAVPIVLAILLPVFPQSAAAQMTVTGESLYIERAPPTIGDILSMTLRFRVEGVGAAIPIAFSAVESARSPDPDRPTVGARNYGIRPGSPHAVRMEYRLPRPAPAEICFNVYAHFVGTGLRNTLLVQNACWGATTRSGTGQRIELKADLTPRIDSATVDRTRDINLTDGDLVSHWLNLSFTIRNSGTAPTTPLGRCWGFSYYMPRAEGPDRPGSRAGWNGWMAAGGCESIPGGGTHAISKTLGIPASASKIRIEVDGDNRQQELSEDNNRVEKGIGFPRLRGVEPVTPDIRRK